MLVFLIILLCATLYSVPGLIATGRHHPKALRIWLVNILLGFTVVGWLWSLREALRRDAVPFRKVYYRYSYYGEETRKKRFDVRQLPLSDVGMAMVGLTVVALAGTFGWKHFAPQPASAEAAAATVGDQHGWTYALDGQDQGAVHVSTLLSNDLDATGSSIPAALIVRSGPGQPTAAIRIQGQFTCSAAANGTITAQFDGRTETLHCAARPDGLSDMDSPGQDLLFIDDPKAFIADARTAKSLTITADVFGQGTKTSHFSPQGLDIAMAGLAEEATVATAAAKPAADEAPVTVQPIAAAAPIPPKATKVSRTTKVAKARKTKAAKTASRRPVHHDKHTVLHPFRPQPHHKSWHN